MIVVLPVSCTREVRDFPQQQHTTGINPQIQASPEFDWSMSQQVLFLVKNCRNKVISIAASDQEVLFHKGYSNSTKYDVTLNLPARISQVLVNGVPVEITGKAVVVELPVEKNLLFADHAVCFDGESAYAETAAPVGDYPFTMSAWFKPEENPHPNESMVVMNLSNSGKTNWFLGLYLEYQQTPGIAAGTISVRAQKGGTLRNLYSDVSVVPGQWYHVAVVFESNQMRRLYINGNPAGEDTRKVNFPGMNVFGLGRWSDKTPDAYFHGAVTEISIWNVARTQNEIMADMESSLSGNESGLAGYWPCNEGSGSIATDLSPSQNDLPLSGTSWCDGLTGGDADGDGIPDEDDDYPNDPLRAFNNFWPAGFGTLVFEDLWPSIGDYDFNDLVLAYRFKTVTNAGNKVVEAFGNFGVMATGAGLENGFGFSLPDMNIPSGNIEVSGFIGDHGVTEFESNGIEAGQTHVTVIVADVLPWVGNTRPENPYIDPVNILVKIDVNGGEYSVSDLGFESFNPFLIVNENRAHEIHLADYPPTDLADLSLFGTLDDATSPPVTYYKSPDNLPWGLNFPEGFSYTSEKDTIWQGHLRFIDWVNSGGILYPDWYTNQPGYRDQNKIYSPN